MFMFDPPPFGGDITLVAGSTNITGTASGILWNNAGVLAAGPATTDASGNIVGGTSAIFSAASNSNPTIAATGSGAAVFFALGGTTPTAGYAKAFSGAIRGFAVSAADQFGWLPASSFGSAADTLLARGGAANVRLGDIAVDTAPIAQTLSVQNTLAGGTSNVAGANFTIAGSQGKGSGGGGSLIFQVAPAGSAGTAVNALATALTIDSTKAATFAGAVTVPGIAVAAFTSTGTFTSGAGASLGTLSNAPSAGNPTSWIKIIDNGVTRYIPAW